MSLEMLHSELEKLADQYDGPEHLKPYGAMNQLAKQFGGPEQLMDTVETYAFQEGAKVGFLQGSIVGVLVTATIGGVIYFVIKKKTSPKTSKQVSAEEAAQAKKKLIEGMKNAEECSKHEKA